MFKSLLSVLVAVSIVTLSQHVKLGKSQHDGKCGVGIIMVLAPI